jgi:hypothetical protein
VKGYYWYRLKVIWTKEVDRVSDFFAKDYRQPGATQPFRLWAYEGVED